MRQKQKLVPEIFSAPRRAATTFQTDTAHLKGAPENPEMCSMRKCTAMTEEEFSES